MSKLLHQPTISCQQGSGSGRAGAQSAEFDLGFLQFRFGPLVISVLVSRFIANGLFDLDGDCFFGVLNLLVHFLYQPVSRFELGKQRGPFQLQVEQGGL